MQINRFAHHSLNFPVSFFSLSSIIFFCVSHYRFVPIRKRLYPDQCLSLTLYVLHLFSRQNTSFGEYLNKGIWFAYLKHMQQINISIFVYVSEEYSSVGWKEKPNPRQNQTFVFASYSVGCNNPVPHLSWSLVFEILESSPCKMHLAALL